jgi:hypothetical protein
MKSSNEYIGILESVDQHVTLIPSWNLLSFSGELRSTSAASFDVLSNVIQHFLTGQTSDVQAEAGPNATSYPLLAGGLQGLTLSVPLPAYNESLIQSLSFETLSLTPSTKRKTIQMSALIRLTINSPLGERSPLEIHQMNLTATLVYRNESIGLLNVSQAAVQSLSNSTYRVIVNETSLILSGDGSAYQRFATDFLTADRSTPIGLNVVGLGSVNAVFALGPIDVQGVAVANEVTLVGLAGFRNVSVTGISIDGEERSQLLTSINVTIVNPGITQIELLDVVLDMSDTINGTRLGFVPVSQLLLEPGENFLSLQGFV